MKKISVIISLFYLTNIFHIYGQITNTENPNKDDSYQVKASYKNPLKGFSAFVFMAAFPSSTKQETDKINAEIKKCLSSFGTVVRSSLITQTKKKEQEVDFSGFSPGGFLHYQITNLTDVTGKKLDILQATLTFTTGIEICKTKEICMPVIWSKSCFFKGNTREKMTTLILQSLNNLLEAFQNEYQSANKEKPVFNFYQS